MVVEESCHCMMFGYGDGTTSGLQSAFVVHARMASILIKSS